MYLRQLVLANFRGYRRLLLDLQPGLTVFVGENGQGKSNLLESVHVLATTRSLRASTERELINWQELEGPLPFARLEGRLVRGNGETHVEIVLRAEASADGAEGGPPAVSRLVRLNGLPARASDVVGQVVVVLFSPEDVALANGPPVGRRRYLDITCSQVSRRYLRSLQSYNRVLVQRNALLRQIRERRQARPSLSPWDDELVDLGSQILAQRLHLVAEVNARLVECYRALSGGSQEVRIAYRATVFEGAELPPLDEADVSAEALADAFRSRLTEVAQRESEQAVTLVGPHRDDFAFHMDGVDLNTFGSRGQQRLAVLALKLCEAAYMCSQTDEQPILLLDDVLSELDPRRRAFVLEHVTNDGQTLLTATDPADLGPGYQGRARFYRVEHGAVAEV